MVTNCHQFVLHYIIRSFKSMLTNQNTDPYPTRPLNTPVDHFLPLTIRADLKASHEKVAAVVDLYPSGQHLTQDNQQRLIALTPQDARG